MKRLAVVLAVSFAVLGCQVAGPQIPTQGTLTAFNKTNQTTPTTVTVTLTDGTGTTTFWNKVDILAGNNLTINLNPGQYTLTIKDVAQTTSGPIMIAAGVDTNWNFFGP